MTSVRRIYIDSRLRTSGTDNDFTYDWYAADWSASLSPSDDPLLTAIELNASGGSGQLALREVELCLEP